MVNSNTKLVQLISQLTLQSKKKFWIFKTIVPHGVFALFLGFVVGNLFGTFLNYFRNFVKWDGLIITFTILAIEFINYLNFKPNKKNFQFKNPRGRCKSFLKKSPLTINYDQLYQDKKTVSTLEFRINNKPITNYKIENFSNLNYHLQKPKICNQYGTKLLNFYKIGLLLGFFIDAFKVGS